MLAASLPLWGSAGYLSGAFYLAGIESPLVSFPVVISEAVIVVVELEMDPQNVRIG